MTRKLSRTPDAALDGLVGRWADEVLARGARRLDRWFLVDVATQRIHLMHGRRAVRWWPVSTAAAGLDARDGSFGTPPGLHRIQRKIGAGAAMGTVFSSREPTGRVWPETPRGEPARQDQSAQQGQAAGPDQAAQQSQDLILTRILTLEGLQEGVNRGPGVDSLARYIYLHGTDREDAIGSPISHGCVRLTNRDVVELFDLADEGDLVVIA